MTDRLIRIGAVFLFVAASSSTGRSEEVGFYFSGSVLNVGIGQNPFQAGITASPATPVSGRVLFNTESAATDPIRTCDCMGYRQHIAGGFTATFGDNTVRADDYIIQVKNDVNQSGIPFDTLAVVFSGAFSPALGSSLLVNGSLYPAGWFQLDVDGPGDTFSDASLPTSLDLSRFTSMWNFLDDKTGYGIPGVIFRNSTLSAFSTHPGDYNGDGWVDESDYDRLRGEFGATSILDADGSRDGVVDAADYVVWRKNASPGLRGAFVPEPGTLSILMVGLFAIGFGRGKFRQCH